MTARIMTAFAALIAFVGPQTSAELANVLQRATDYVTRYEAELGNLIGAEEYIQNAVWLAP